MAGVTPNTRRLCEEVLAWQAKSKEQRVPNQHSDDAEEMRLGKRFTNLLLRRFRSIGAGRKPSEKQLNPDELALVNSVPGVPVRGCAATVTATSLSEEQQTALKAAEGIAHIEAFGAMHDEDHAPQAPDEVPAAMAPQASTSVGSQESGAISDAVWYREEPGFLKDLTFHTQEAKEETCLYYDGLKMLFCYLRGSLSQEAICHVEAGLGKDFFKDQLRDVCLGLEATAHHLGEQNPHTAGGIALMIINAPTEELDTLLQLFGQCANAASG